MNSLPDVFTLNEQLRNQDYLLATYYLQLNPHEDVLKAAAAFAIGQTLGTWTVVPGVTDEMRARHEGRVVKILEAPAADLASQETTEHAYFIQLALPTINFDAQFPMMLTTLLGNDASTSVQAKLVDLEFPQTLAEQFGGPRWGIEGVRELIGIYNRPLLLNMIKPCVGLSPKEGAKVFYETALGGVDIIKDDELLASPSYSPVAERVKEYGVAARAVREETGKDVLYIPNVTDSPHRLIDNAQRAVDAGARAVMVTFATTGYGALQALTEAVDVPILGHCAGAGVFFEGPDSGMSAHLALGTLPRIGGADMVVMATPYGGYPMRQIQYRRIIQQMTLPLPHLLPTMPVVGGGVHPGTVARYVGELGNDIVLAAGGSIQGHPGGPAAGARAMLGAIEAAASGLDVKEAAASNPDLQTAVHMWGILE